MKPRLPRVLVYLKLSTNKARCSLNICRESDGQFIALQHGCVLLHSWTEDELGLPIASFDFKARRLETE